MRPAVRERIQLKLVHPPPQPSPGGQARDVAAGGEQDEELVVQALSGDAKARRALYDRHVAYLSAMTSRMLRSSDASEDVVQETFISAFSKLGSLKDAKAFRAWLTVIAVRLVRSRIRRARLLKVFGVTLALDDVPLSEMAHDDLSAEARSELHAIDVGLATLPASHRIAWTLRRVEGLPLEEVAAAAECSLATAKRRIAAGDARVRAYVEEEALAKEERS
jgi:RNA polymerase sigma-70 factor (ECF subfamily)